MIAGESERNVKQHTKLCKRESEQYNSLKDCCKFIRRKGVKLPKRLPRTIKRGSLRGEVEEIFKISIIYKQRKLKELIESLLKIFNTVVIEEGWKSHLKFVKNCKGVSEDEQKNGFQGC